MSTSANRSSRRKQGLLRRNTLLISVMALGVTFHAPVETVYAQGGSSATAASNPILTELARVDPSQVRVILQKLEPLKFGALRPGSRGEFPTAYEASQLAQNPDFAAAYQHDPCGILKLLRQINRRLHRPDDMGSARSECR